jgi:predicted NBD/HSP70 family sugar kinase
VIGLDISNQSFRGAVINLQGDIIQSVSLPVENKIGLEALHLIYELIDILISQTNSQIIGIGVGTPGLVDAQSGVVRTAVNLGWENLPLQEILAERYQTEVYVANDSHAAVLAEYNFGPTQNKASSNLAVIKVGQGIGAGILINGSVFYGDGFAAGEIGHVVVENDGKLCSCGNNGCLETTSSTRAMRAQAKDFALLNPESFYAKEIGIDWDTIINAFDAGDEDTIKLVSEAGKYLGIGIANLVGLLNLEKIVISGRVSHFGDTYLDAIRASLHQRTLSTIAEQVEISFSALGPEIGILGSSAMVLKNELGIF